MKKILLPLTILLTFHAHSFAQWNVMSYAGGQNFNCVNYYSSTDIWLGTSMLMLKSDNGGAKWTAVQTYDIYNNWIESSSINSIAVINPTTVAATGLLYSGNREHILLTTNGGTSWTFSIYELASSPPQYLNSIDLFSTRGIAVGSNGHIVRSEDSGNSWTMSNRTSGLLRDVKFATFDTVIAVGENLILRSVDGGASWTWTNQTGSFKNVSCVKNNVYVGLDGNTMLKSLDYGATFTTLNLPFSYLGVLYAVDKNTVLAAGTDGIYVSKDGGTTWRKYALPSYKQVKMFDFLTPSSGIAVGEGGYIVKTDNLDGATLETPTPSFSIQNGSEFCLGDSVKLSNTTSPIVGNTYEWKLDGITFSTSYHAAIKLTTAGTRTITLIVTNGGTPATTSQTVLAKGHDTLNPIDFVSINDTTCSKNVVGFYINRSKIGASYQLRKGFTNIGPLLIGNDSILRFADTVGITASTLYNIKEIVHGCFTDSISTSKMIYVMDKKVDVAAVIPPKKFCFSYMNNPGISRVTFNGINHASTSEINNYFDYSCCYQTNVDPGKGYDLLVRIYGFYEEEVRVWIDYNNDGIFSATEQVLSARTNDLAYKNVIIPPSAINNKYLRMRVKADRDSAGINNPGRVNCGQIKDYAINVVFIPPVASFTKTVSLVNCLPQAAFKNTSTSASSYVWNFGDGTPTSNLVNPTHDYAVSGTYTVTLTASNSSASISTSQSITVTVPQIPKPAACVPTVTPSSIATLVALQIDTTVIALNGASSYKNFTCTRQLHLRAGQFYDFKLTPRNTNECSLFGIWLDYNNDGVFTPEEALTTLPNSERLCYGTPVSLKPKIKETPNINIPLRMRVMVYSTNIWTVMDGCNSGELTGGEVDDFTVFIDPIFPVKADFDVDNKIVCSNDWLRCINKSTYATRYLWDYGDGETDTTEAPFSHHYKQLGTYTIKLKVFNSISVDSITKVNYVNAVQAPDKPVVTLNGKTLVSSIVADKYYWTNMDSVILKGTGPTFNPPHDANYQLVVSNTYGCTNYGNFAYFPVHARFTFQSTAACNDPAFMIFDSIPRNTDYTVTWGDGFTDVYPKASGLPYHYYTTAGTYTVKVVGCNDLGCDSLIRPNYVTIYPKLPVPVVVENAGILSTPAVAAGYQWHSGGEIFGATSSSASNQ